MRELLQQARIGGYAVPSFCVWSAESMHLVLAAAERLRSPVILMAGPCEMTLLNPAQMIGIYREVRRGYTVPMAFHLDHGDTLEICWACIEAGFDAVMLDFSARSFADNVAALKAVSARAHALGISVEGELGAVGRVDEGTPEGQAGSVLTDPALAEEFVRETGVDALAVAIGNAHGIYTRLPEFDIPRLEAIHRRVDTSLVLHGGSGTPDAVLRRAIGLGIAKVNVASDLVRALQSSLLTKWARQPKSWPTTDLADAYRAMEPAVAAWIERLGSAGKA
jgi:tagatose 1,6-diphosphate aldolase GatY/KbaY